MLLPCFQCRPGTPTGSQQGQQAAGQPEQQVGQPGQQAGQPGGLVKEASISSALLALIAQQDEDIKTAEENGDPVR